MLTQEVKRKIDTARDILVGKVPDPKAQVEQITTALIYKFMDDMDKESMSLPNGKARFFTNGFEKYAWTKLLDPKLGGHDRLDLYMEAITKLSLNPHIPQLFRDIFKDTFLPYRNPETLSLFLKEINGFTYEHSEDLGDSFEYLLSILGSQGDAGQFRTPRHIIDFIVKCVNPKKDDVICDPACGTAGFLISAYKHILKQHDGVDDPNKKEKPLSPDERKSLMDNFVGYDISPDMVKLSKVNLYLHGFPNPTIYEYDTLSSEERWDDSFDVMLANPPFMTPKGGIKPHKRFSIQANRSEVLFVDYILEHLRPNGRAGIIVPEGIVFQSANAYKSLRKMLVEDGLYCVVSLPAGIFQPYSGVKTSILLLDKEISKKTNDILFVKIENDGFDLGAQRKVIDNNDLPMAVNNINDYRNYVLGLNTTNVFIDFIMGNKKVGDVIFSTYANYSIVSKNVILASKEVILTSNRYREDFFKEDQKWPMVALDQVLEYEQPTKYIVNSVNYSNDNKTPVLTAGKTFILGYTNETKGIFNKDLPVIIFDDFTTATKLVDFPFKVKSSAMKILHVKNGLANIKYLYYVMQDIKFSSSTHKRYWISEYSKIKIPLPPLDIQNEIVKEIESYQKIVDGAKQIVENWKPNFDVDESWKLEKLGGIVKMIRGPFGGSLKKEIFKSRGYLVYEQYHAINNDFNFERYFIDENKFREMKRFEVFAEDILISCSGTMGKIAIVPPNNKHGIINQALLKLSADKTKVIPIYLKNILESKSVQEKYFKNQMGVAIQNVPSVKILSNIDIPLPSLRVQKQIVKKIEREQEIIYANKALIDIFEQNIKNVIAKLWNE